MPDPGAPPFPPRSTAPRRLPRTATPGDTCPAMHPSPSQGLFLQRSPQGAAAGNGRVQDPTTDRPARGRSLSTPPAVRAHHSLDACDPLLRGGVPWASGDLSRGGMGKRSRFDRVDRDFYPTPAAAVQPLLKRIGDDFSFVEPCAGAGDLVGHLVAGGGRCMWAFDSEPADPGIRRFDAFDMRLLDRGPPDYIITNPPWSRQVLHRMIPHFAAQRPTWLLFDADWIHTAQSVPFLPLLRCYLSVGRVRWIAGSAHTGKDNVAWYLFDFQPGPCELVGRG